MINIFFCSILASFHPCDNDHPNTVSNCRQFFNELNVQCFDFKNGFKCKVVHIFEKLKILSRNLCEINFYQDQNEWKHNLIPIEIKKKESVRIVELFIYKTHFALTKKLHVILGNHYRSFISRWCLNSYTKENMLMLHKPKC